jgi:hypothetical protein
MQQGITPVPDVDDFDPNVDPGGNKGLDEKREAEDQDVPLPPDVTDREPVEDPRPEPPPVEEPFEPPPKPIL